jgi:predicted nuclease with TOPRIM domain
MYEDPYYPKFLVDDLKSLLLRLVEYLYEQGRSREEIQEKFDETTININNLQERFHDNDSEIDDVASDCLKIDVEYILKYFALDLTVEEALRERAW